MIDLAATAAQLSRNPPVAITPFVAVVNITYANLQIRIFIDTLLRLSLIVERTARELSYLEQSGQGVLLP